MGNIYHVYAKCWAPGRLYLQTEYTGPRYQCEKFVKDRVRTGRPTHFLFVSKLDINKASKRYLP